MSNKTIYKDGQHKAFDTNVSAVLRNYCLPFIIFMASPVVANTASANDEERTSYAYECSDYDKFVLRGTEAPTTSMCESLTPQMGGFRENLAEHGFGFQAAFSPSLTYDILQNNDQGPQTYNGQEVTRGNTGLFMLTYDASRWGLNPGSQFAFGMTSGYNSYAGDQKHGINSTHVRRASAYLPLNDHVSLQAGYYDLSSNFYGGTIGTNIGATARSPATLMTAQVGAKGFKPVPAFDIKVKGPGKRFYYHFGMGRSTSPAGPYEDAERNDTGLRFDMEGAGPVYINEIGYRREASHGTKAVWLRAGGVYNTSSYDELGNEPKSLAPFALNKSEDNTGFYALADIQLTQNEIIPALGWRISLRYNEADDVVNTIDRDVSATLYSFGTFASRPRDVFSIGVSKLFASDKIVNAINEAQPLRPFVPAIPKPISEDRTTYTASYAYRVRPGLYVQPNIAYIDDPGTSPSKEALNVGLNLAFLF